MRDVFVFVVLGSFEKNLTIKSSKQVAKIFSKDRHLSEKGLKSI